MTFGAWLIDQADRGDDVGELAGAVVDEFGDTVASYGVETLADMLEQSFAREVAAVLQVAEVEWRGVQAGTMEAA